MAKVPLPAPRRGKKRKKLERKGKRIRRWCWKARKKKTSLELTKTILQKEGSVHLSY